MKIFYKITLIFWMVAWASSFFIHPLFSSTYVTYGMPCHTIGRQMLHTPNPLPREAEDFPRGGNYSKHLPLPTYLAWLQPIYYDLKFVFIRVKLRKFLLVVKTLIKKHRAAATLISHELRNWKNCFLKKCISEHRHTSKLLPQKCISEHGCLKMPTSDY